MNTDKIFNQVNLKTLKYPNNVIPKGAKPFCQIDSSNGKDRTCITRGFMDNDGVIYIQEMEYPTE